MVELSVITLSKIGEWENAFVELLKFSDLAKDEDRAAYAVSCMVEMFVQEKRVDEIFPLLPRLSVIPQLSLISV